MRRLYAARLVILAFAASSPLRAQDTVRLERLQEVALQRDPRASQLPLLEAQSALRLRNIATERLPQLSLVGEATHQSDVTTIGIATASGSPPQPPKDRWQAILNAQQLLYDGGSIAGRRAVERARLAESRETVLATVYRLRSEVDASFFNAFLLQERDAQLVALMDDLAARLKVLSARVQEGAALRGDVAAVEAEQLRAQQSREESRAGRRAALAVLERLTGQQVSESSVLALPNLDGDVARLRGATDTIVARERPEFALFARTRERIGREVELARAEVRPRVFAFGQAGYGRPGLDQFNTRPDEFWIAGVRMEWRFWNWGNVIRQRDELRFQDRIVQTEEEAFAESLDRAVQSDLEEMMRLDNLETTDEQIITLREQVERQARAQLDEGAITAADYVDARTDLLEARLARQRHRVELAQVRSRYLTTLGITPTAVEPRE